jgi:hypothetical protein
MADPTIRKRLLDTGRELFRPENGHRQVLANIKASENKAPQ